MRRFSVRLFWGCALALIWPLVGWAHDPCEITSTASLKTNRLDVQIEMEFRTAMVLTGEAGVVPAEISQAELFQTKLLRLRELAGGFYEITAGGNRLAARTTNVVLGAENHVRFELEFPNRRERPLRFNAEGLKAFMERGPYGTTLTVLDLVHPKVLGQVVLFAGDPVVEIPGLPRTNAGVVPIPPAIAEVSTAFTPPTTTAPIQPVIPATIPPARSGLAPSAIILALAIVAFLLWLWRIKNRSTR